MKIVIMITSLSTGGSERTAVALANWLANKGVETYLFNLGINENNYEIDSKVILYNKNISPKIMEKIKSYIDVIKTLREIKPDIIFEMLFKPMKYALINKLTNSKLVIIGSERNNPKERYKSLKLKFLSRICPLLCDGYIFQTEKVKSMFSKKIQNKSIVIGNAISNPDIYNIRNVYNKEKNIVAAGRLTYQKGYDTLIKAFYKVYNKHPEYKLIIYGEGEERENLKELINKLKLNGKVLLPGTCKDYLYKVANAEIFVMTSRFEGMPNVLLEAMSIGMPCISTDCIAGPSEIIENNMNGILVEVDNIDEIAFQLNKLIENDDFRKEISENAKKIYDKFSKDKIYKKYYEYFNSFFTQSY